MFPYAGLARILAASEMGPRTSKDDNGGDDRNCEALKSRKEARQARRLVSACLLGDALHRFAWQAALDQSSSETSSTLYSQVGCSKVR